jgi:hypothetical protein
VSPEVDHRLDGEAHPCLTLSDLLVLRVVRNVGCAVEELVHAMPNINLHHATVSLLCDSLNSVAKVSQ